MKDKISELVQDAGFLSSHLREAHSLACRENPILVILLLDLLEESKLIERRINEIEGCL